MDNTELENLHYEDHQKIFKAVDSYHKVIILEEKIKELEKDRASNAMWTRTFLPMLITSVVSLFAYFTVQLGTINSELAAREVRISRNTEKLDQQQALDLEQDKAITDVYKKLEHDNLDIYDRISAISERVAKLEK